MLKIGQLVTRSKWTAWTISVWLVVYTEQMVRTNTCLTTKNQTHQVAVAERKSVI